MKRVILFIGVCQCLLFTAQASESDSSQSHNNQVCRHRIELNNQFSFTGLHTGVGYTYMRQHDEVSVALRIPAALLSRGEYTGTGAFLCYRRLFPLSSFRWSMVADMAYGNLFRATASPVNERKGVYQLHEAYVGYGWQWRASHWCVGNTLGYGYYVETQTNFYSSTPLNTFGHGAQIKLWLGYAF